ncbi:MAG: class I SAM-dependent methyltransferase [Eubacteriales bacterium]
MIKISIEYYDKNSEKYINNTFHVNMEPLLTKFAFHIPKGGLILDAGCGTGRDSIWFVNHGYKVLAFDGSKEMVKYAKDHIDGEVMMATFESFDCDKEFDGIWACSSLLHVKRSNMVEIIEKLASYLKPKGSFFMSFKDRDEDYVKDGRVFTNYSEKGLRQLINSIDDLITIEIIKTTDVRKGREDEHWVSVIAKKKE